MKKIISLILALIMVLGMAVPAFAWRVQSIKVTGTYSGGKLNSITASIDWDLGDANCRLILMDKCLISPSSEGGSGSYGDFTNRGNYRASFTSITEIANDSNLGVISYTDEKELEYGSTANKLKMNIADGNLDTAGIYYIYLWTRVNTNIYPDNLVAAIQVDSNGDVTYSPVLEGKRNTYDDTAFKAVEEEKYTFEYAYDCQRSKAYPKKGEEVTLSGFGNPYISSNKDYVAPAGKWSLTEVKEEVANSELTALLTNVAREYGVKAEDLPIFELKLGEDHIAYGVIMANSSGVTLFVGDTGVGTGGTGYALSNGELSGSKTVIIAKDATDEDPMDVPTVATYTVTYYNEDGGVVYTETVEEGKDVQNVPNVPAKDGYDKTAPTWDKDGKNITANTEIRPVYYINTYTVTYVADGVTVGQSQTVEHGEDAVAPAIPEKEGYTQTAPNWNHDGKNITADTTINAVYTINTYTVKYYADGKLVDEQTVEHGKAAVAPTVPEKEGYTQTAPVWDKDGKNITEDTEINAVYTINNYKVKYYADGKLVDEQTVEHGEDAVAPAIPEKEGYTQTASVWDKDGKNITADTTINAVYTINKYTVKFVFYGITLKTEVVEHGSDATAPMLMFNHRWSHNGKNITEDTIIRAIPAKGSSNKTEIPVIREEDEVNPSTGAPVFAPVAVIAAATLVFAKRK